MHAAASAFWHLWPWAVVISLIAGLGGLARSRRPRRGPDPSNRAIMGLKTPYDPGGYAYRKRTLVTPAEREFHALLVRALPEYVVFTQVAMSALIEPASIWADRQGARNRFARKYVDFVLCDRASLEVVAIVELDDPSHDGNEYRDASRDEMLGSAGYTVLRWDVRSKPSEAEVIVTVSGVKHSPRPWDVRDRGW